MRNLLIAVCLTVLMVPPGLAEPELPLSEPAVHGEVAAVIKEMGAAIY